MLKAKSLGQFLFCVIGIYVSYITYGLIQEWIYIHKNPDGSRFKFTFTLLLVQCTANAIMAYIVVLSNKPKPIPYLKFAFVGLPYIGAMLTSNEALKFVSYPMQALAKSTKMVPVMLANVVIFGRRYTFKEYLFVTLVTVGIVIFQWKDGGKESQTYGILLLVASLVLDGVTSPYQEHLRDRYHPSVHQLMLTTNISALWILVVLLFTVGEGYEGIMFCLDPANATIASYILIFSVCSAVGQNFIFTTIHNFGSLTCSTVTTTRKFFTIMASVFIYGHHLGWVQWIAVTLVFIGLAIEVDNSRKRQHHKQ